MPNVDFHALRASVALAGWRMYISPLEKTKYVGVYGNSEEDLFYVMRDMAIALGVDHNTIHPKKPRKRRNWISIPTSEFFNYAPQKRRRTTKMVRLSDGKWHPFNSTEPIPYEEPPPLTKAQQKLKAREELFSRNPKR